MRRKADEGITARLKFSLKLLVCFLLNVYKVRIADIKYDNIGYRYPFCYGESGSQRLKPTQVAESSRFKPVEIWIVAGIGVELLNRDYLLNLLYKQADTGLLGVYFQWFNASCVLSVSLFVHLTYNSQG